MVGGEPAVKGTLKGLARRAGLRRAGLASARLCCERNALAMFGNGFGQRFGKRPAREAGRILCYHSVGQPL